jgi:hypothetical protein
LGDAHQWGVICGLGAREATVAREEILSFFFNSLDRTSGGLINNRTK